MGQLWLSGPIALAPGASNWATFASSRWKDCVSVLPKIETKGGRVDIIKRRYGRRSDGVWKWSIIVKNVGTVNLVYRLQACQA